MVYWEKQSCFSVRHTLKGYFVDSAFCRLFSFRRLSGSALIVLLPSHRFGICCFWYNLNLSWFCCFVNFFLDTISPYIKNICLQILTVFSFGGVFCAARQNQGVPFLYRIFPLPACLGLCPSALADSSHPSLLAGTSHCVFASSAHPKNFR